MQAPPLRGSWDKDRLRLNHCGKAPQLSAPTVVFVAAVITNVDAIAVGVDSERNFIGEEIFVAL